MSYHEDEGVVVRDIKKKEMLEADPVKTNSDQLPRWADQSMVGRK